MGWSSYLNEPILPSNYHTTPIRMEPMPASPVHRRRLLLTVVEAATPCHHYDEMLSMVKLVPPYDSCSTGHKKDDIFFVGKKVRYV